MVSPSEAIHGIRARERYLARAREIEHWLRRRRDIGQWSAADWELAGALVLLIRAIRSEVEETLR